MPKRKPTPKAKQPRSRHPYLKGFPCPTCVGVRLHVVATTRRIRGLIVRYRKCSVCGHKVKTEERVSKDNYGPPNG